MSSTPIYELGFYLGESITGWDGEPGEFIILYKFTARPDLSLHNFGEGDLQFDYSKNYFTFSDPITEEVLATGSYLDLLNEVSKLPLQPKL